MGGEITEAYAEGFDASREYYLGPSAELLFLKTDGGLVAYTVLEQLSEAWDIDRPGKADRKVFLVAIITEAFNEIVEQGATHLVPVNTTNAALNNRLFEIDRGTDPPQAEDYWQIVTRPTGKRYVPA